VLLGFPGGSLNTFVVPPSYIRAIYLIYLFLNHPSQTLHPDSHPSFQSIPATTSATFGAHVAATHPMASFCSSVLLGGSYRR